MLNYIWFGMLIIGFAVGIMNGKIEEVTLAAINSSKNAVELCIGLLGILCMWSGIMKIAEKAGMLKVITKIARPFASFLFPNIPKNHPVLGSIMMNLTANFLGMGNAATPMGIRAISELQELNIDKGTATDEMCMFLVLNTACIQLIPATIIALRAAAGAKNPMEITLPIWIASLFSCFVGIVMVKILAKWGNINGNN